MGTFRVSIEVGDPAGQRYEAVEALVDTGATYATLPAPLLQSLEVVPHTRDTFVLADGSGWSVISGAPGSGYALEGLRLAADPVGRRLTPVPGLLLSREASVADTSRFQQVSF